jgi:hypothetical protein
MICNPEYYLGLQNIVTLSTVGDLSSLAHVRREEPIPTNLIAS